jgi:hypothetical protein
MAEMTQAGCLKRGNRPASFSDVDVGIIFAF